MLKKAIIAAVFLTVFILNIRPIEVGDFWWHMTTGKWIVDNSALPDEAVYQKCKRLLTIQVDQTQSMFSAISP